LTEATLVKRKNGFNGILEEVQEEIMKKPNQLFEIAITLNNRIPYNVGIKSLSFFQNEFFEIFNEYKLALSSEYRLLEKEKSFVYKLGLTSYGKLTISKDIETDMFITIGYISLNAKQSLELQKRTSIKRKYFIEECQKIRGQFINNNQQKLKDMLDFVYFTIYHMAPVLTYIDEYTYNNFYQSNNLIQVMGGKSTYFMLDELKTKDVIEWKDKEVVFIYLMYWLIKSGGPARGEEFNGVQLLPQTLNSFLDEKISIYQDALNISNGKVVHGIEQKSKYVSELRKQMQERYVFYRHINGLNLHKEERFVPKSLLGNNEDSDVDTTLQVLLLENYSLDLNAYPNVYNGFRDLIVSILNSKSIEEGIIHPLERVFQDIVDCAVKATNSDVGMTRGIRDINAFINANDNELFDQACSWEQSDYFTCVVPCSEIKQMFKGKEKILSGILKSIAARMQYNGWHYLPGNIPYDKIPVDRHFFFPPVMPDTTELSNQHHKGHIHAGVKYAIRSPEKITYKGKEYISFTDLRLMRQKGTPFTHEEFLLSLKFSSYLKQYYQALIDVVSIENKDVKINSFDKKWYDEVYK
jgi:hypothetical protein